MATSNASEWETTGIASKCNELGVICSGLACSIEDLLDRHPGEPALDDLIHRLREYTGTFDQLPQQLRESPAMSSRVQASINTSLSNFHDSLIHLQERVKSATLSATSGNAGQVEGLTVIWPAKDIRTEGQILGFQLQNATLLISSIQKDAIEEKAAEPHDRPEIAIHTRTASNASNSTTITSPSGYTSSPMGSPNPGQIETPHSVLRETGSQRSTANHAKTPMQTATSTSNPDRVSSIVAAQTGNSNASGITARRKVARSFTWKLTTLGKLLASQLCQACEENDLPWVKSLLKAGAYVNGYSTNRPNGEKSPLILALGSHALDIVEILLENGANVNLTGIDKKKPLRIEMDNVLASKDRSLQYLDLLVRHGANPNQTMDGRTPLGLSIKCGRPDLVDFFLKRGATTTRSDIQRAMALEDEVMGREVAATVIRSGAPVDLDPAHDFYPLLHVISSLKSLAWVKLLVSQGANPTIICNKTLTVTSGEILEQWSLIHLCVIGGKRSDILEYLLSMNASPNTECIYSNINRHLATSSKFFPLHLAETAQDVHTLVRYGANIHHVGFSPLHWAAINGRSEVILANLEHGAPPNTRSHSGNTPLHSLITILMRLEPRDVKTEPIIRYYDSAKVLLEAGARVDLRGAAGQTADEMVDLLPPFYTKLSREDQDYLEKKGWDPKSVFDDIRALISQRSGRVIVNPPTPPAVAARR